MLLQAACSTIKSLIRYKLIDLLYYNYSDAFTVASLFWSSVVVVA